MEGTPKLKKRGSLSLGRHHKRDASIFQQELSCSKVRAIVANEVNNNEDSKGLRIPKSPVITSLPSDSVVACTPPHKKINLDDSVEYSPRFWDSSISPSSLLSQTLTTNSPEVGWKWGRHSVDEQVEPSVITPDSAYITSSGFTSVSPRYPEATDFRGRIRSESYTQRFAYEKQKEEQRRKLEIEMRRIEKLRADELLKQRCAKLKEQLKQAEKRREEKDKSNNKLPQNVCRENERKAMTLKSSDLAAIEDIFSNANDTLNDFFNDSDADGLLLEATQQVESEWQEVTQETSKDIYPTKGYSDFISNNDRECLTTDLKREVKIESDSEPQEKRSSLYMKLLEDDSPDDWFLSLDDVITKPTQQAKKARTSFQRHNSMPTNTTSTLANGSALSTCTSVASTASEKNSYDITTTTITSKSVSAPKIKRSASSHFFNSTPGNISKYREGKAYSRK